MIFPMYTTGCKKDGGSPQKISNSRDNIIINKISIDLINFNHFNKFLYKLFFGVVKLLVVGTFFYLIMIFSVLNLNK